MRIQEWRRPGGAAVEFVVVLPVLLSLVLGGLDFGRFAHSYIAVTNAARAGAGFAATHPYTQATYDLWQAGVRQAVVDELSPLAGFDPSQLTVSITVTNLEGGSRQIEVLIGYPFQTLAGWPGYPGTVTLQRAVVMHAVRL